MLFAFNCFTKSLLSFLVVGQKLLHPQSALNTVVPPASGACCEVLTALASSGVSMRHEVLRLRVCRTWHNSRRDWMRVRRNVVQCRCETYCNLGCPGACIHVVGILDVDLLNAFLDISLWVRQSAHCRAGYYSVRRRNQVLRVPVHNPHEPADAASLVAASSPLFTLDLNLFNALSLRSR